MKTLNLCRRALSIFIAAVILAACGGSQSAAPQVPAASGQIGSALVAHGADRVSPDQIVYTPANVQIENSDYNLDLNNDKTTDFVIKDFNIYRHDFDCPGKYNYYGGLSLTGQSSNGVVTSASYAARLTYGSQIGPGQSFSTGSWTMEEYERVWQGWPFCAYFHKESGNWGPGSSGYLGLAFIISGKTHYGWAAITVHYPYLQILSATLTGYAYQTRAGQSILAGQK